MRTESIRGVAVVSGAAVALCFSLMAICGRVAASYSISPFLTMAIRSCFGLTVTAAQHVCMPRAQRKAELRVAWANYGLLMLRGPFSWAGATGAFWAYSERSLALGDVAALYQTTPLWTILLAWLFLRAKLRWPQCVAAALALVGAMILAKPTFLFGTLPTSPTTDAADSDRKMLTVLVVLASAAGAGTAFVIVQALNNRSVGATVQVFCNLLFNTTIGFALSAALGVCTLPPDLPWRAWAAIVGVGVSGTLGQLGTVYAVRLDSATTFAITQQLDVVLNFIADALLFGQHVGATSVGGALVICSGVGFLALHKSKAVDSARGELVPSDSSAEDKA